MRCWTNYNLHKIPSTRKSGTLYFIFGTLSGLVGIAFINNLIELLTLNVTLTISDYAIDLFKSPKIALFTMTSIMPLSLYKQNYPSCKKIIFSHLFFINISTKNNTRNIHSSKPIEKDNSPSNSLKDKVTRQIKQHDENLNIFFTLMHRTARLFINLILMYTVVFLGFTKYNAGFIHFDITSPYNNFLLTSFQQYWLYLLICLYFFRYIILFIQEFYLHTLPPEDQKWWRLFTNVLNFLLLPFTISALGITVAYFTGREYLLKSPFLGTVRRILTPEERLAYWSQFKTDLMKKFEKLDPEVFRKKTQILNEYLNTAQEELCKSFDHGSEAARISIEESVEEFYNQIQLPPELPNLTPIKSSSTDWTNFLTTIQNWTTQGGTVLLNGANTYLNPFTADPKVCLTSWAVIILSSSSLYLSIKYREVISQKFYDFISCFLPGFGGGKNINQDIDNESKLQTALANTNSIVNKIDTRVLSLERTIDRMYDNSRATREQYESQTALVLTHNLKLAEHDVKLVQQDTSINQLFQDTAGLSNIFSGRNPANSPVVESSEFIPFQGTKHVIERIAIERANPSNLLLIIGRERRFVNSSFARSFSENIASISEEPSWVHAGNWEI